MTSSWLCLRQGYGLRPGLKVRRTNDMAPWIVYFAAKPLELNSLHSILKSIPNHAGPWRWKCYGRALRCSLSVQERLAKEPGLGILCRMPTEDLRAGPKLIGQPPKGKRFNVQQKRQLAAGLQVLCRTCTSILHNKTPSFRGPAVAPSGDGG